MTLIVNTKTKKEEKIIKAILNGLSIGFYTEAEEDAALHRAMEKGRKTKLLTPIEKLTFLQKLNAAK